MTELKFDPGFRVIGECLTHTDSILRVNLTQLLNITIVKPKQAGTCGRGIRNEHMSNH